MDAKAKLRFSKKVNKTADDGCHVWIGARTRGNYGHFRLGKKMVSAHRVIWEEIHGPIPSNMRVCHACNNPSCVNPAHLYLDTHSSNMNKMSDMGRLAKGVRHGNAKLTDQKVQQIHEMKSSGKYSNSEIAKTFGVTSETISKVLTGKRWRHVTE